MTGPFLELTDTLDDSKVWVNMAAVSRMFRRTVPGTSTPTITVLSFVSGAGYLHVKESPESIATLLHRSGGAGDATHSS